MRRAPIRGFLGILPALLGALGCPDASLPPVAIDLVERFPLAKTRTETRSIDFASPESREHLIDGWGRPSGPRTARSYGAKGTTRLSG